MTSRSKWIWKNTRNLKDDYAEFTAPVGFTGEKTFLKISADSEYAVFINDEFVYAGQYSDFPWYKIYDNIDITAYLRRGENVCSVWVWRCGDRNFCHYINRSAVRFEISGGGKTLFVSDENTLSRSLPPFKSGYKKIITRQMGYSFLADYTERKQGFKNSVAVSGLPERVFLRPIKRLTVLNKVSAKKICGNVYDLGRETVGFPFVTANIPFGKTIGISFGEWLDNGRVPRRIGERDFSFSLKGNGKVVYFVNYLRKIGCRYFETEGECEITDIGIIPVEYPFKEKPVALEGVRRQIYDVSVRTLKLNAFEHYFDCPWREQAFYGLDGMLQMRYGYSAFVSSEYQYGALKLMSEDKNRTGMISITVPTSDKTVIPSFALFYVIAMAEYALNTGDLRLVKKYYHKIKQITRKFENNLKSGVLEKFSGKYMWNFYEWNEGLSGGSSARYDAALTFTFILELLSVIKICEMLSFKEDAKYYESLVKELKDNANTLFYDMEKGLYKLNEKENVYSELVNAYAVLTETADKERACAICRKLTDKESGMIPCTLSMSAFKYDALIKVDPNAYGEYILKEIDERFFYMLSRGATSFWETLKGKDDFLGAGSLCHGWSALPVYYYRTLLL